MRLLHCVSIAALAMGALATCGFAAEPATAWSELILYDFSGGQYHAANSLSMDAKGKIYGTTFYGGGGSGCPGYGCGAAFELTPPSTTNSKWKHTVLHVFGASTPDGEDPDAGLTIDAKGNLYGTTVNGGAFAGSLGGAVFELRPPAKAGGKWTETVLHSFQACGANGCSSDGRGPQAGLIMDANGNLYGTTTYGGGGGDGAVFELTPPVATGGTWNETVLYSFGAVANDGIYPVAGLIMDAKGNLYGTTYDGGSGGCYYGGCGTVFELAPPATTGGAWNETVLYRFGGAFSVDGQHPAGGVIMDAKGNLYGTTSSGGGSGCSGSDPGCGTVFELAPPVTTGGAWSETVLYRFGATSGDGKKPAAGLIMDAKGNLFGTNSGGGLSGCGVGCGAVFELSPPTAAGGKWKEVVLHRFGASRADGKSPEAGLMLDAKGDLYGTTQGGGDYGCYRGCGTIFELTP